MDLDYLERRRLATLRRAERAATPAAAQEHRGLAQFYADWIARLRAAGA